MRFFTQLLCNHDYRLRRIRRAKRKGFYNENMYYCSKCGKRKKQLTKMKESYYYNSWTKIANETPKKLKEEKWKD